ncbi:MAG TPA: glycosyltransferase [Pyrinomonadaceae bacterium]|nr:glycosyltransferase [Pyrinomonadaceae bacterium]
MKRISIVIPVYQNELNIAPTYEALTTELEKSDRFDFEIVFVNDGSTDDSWEELLKVYRADQQRVTLINLLRNFGQVPALLAGFANASGDCVVAMSADLQDPPSVVLEMAEEWERGHKLVVATRESRRDGFLNKLTSKMFYRLMRKFALPNMPLGGYDFFLIDRSIVELLLKMDERNRFLQGQILWLGHRPKLIMYERRKRELGKSQWSMSRKVKYFIDGFVAYSFFPIRLVSVAGIAVFFVGLILSAIIAVQTILFGTKAVGWSSLMVALLTLNGLQMMMIGVMGEYLWRNFDETRKRPLYLIEHVSKSKQAETGQERARSQTLKPEV